MIFMPYSAGKIYWRAGMGTNIKELQDYKLRLCWPLQISRHMQIESPSNEEKQMLAVTASKPTLGNLIDTIEFIKKPKGKTTASETDSISSNHSGDGKQKSKVWTEEEIQLFHILLKKHGTDFHILSNFFPKKTKNQLKNRYKMYMNGERKKESGKFRALSVLFKDMSEKEEKEEKDEESSMKS